jgi:hypothetical protein
MRFLKQIIVAVFLFALSLTPLHSQQSQTTAVTIKVIDASGAPVPHAKIRLYPAPANPPAKMETDDSGVLTLPLKSGTYDLSVQQTGFKTFKSPLDILDSVPTQTFPIVLEVGAYSGPSITTVAPASTTDPPASAKPLLLLSSAQKKLQLTSVELATLPHITVTVKNAHNDAQETYSGVRLSDLLLKIGAPLGKDLRGKSMLTFIKASGSDGYAVVFSLAELDPDFHPDEIIVADQMNGQPLDAKSGPFKLVATEDKRTARWVRNLVSLELKSAD